MKAFYYKMGAFPPPPLKGNYCPEQWLLGVGQPFLDFSSAALECEQDRLMLGHFWSPLGVDHLTHYNYYIRKGNV